MSRQIVWLTGMSGAGKTFTGDYLCREHGFVHVDGDAAFLSADPADQNLVSDLHKAFADWLNDEETDKTDMWVPFMDKLCKRVVTSALEHPTKNIVVTFSNYRSSVRLYCRNLIKELLSVAGDDSSFRYIALVVSKEEFAKRHMYRIGKFLATQGWSLQHYWDNIKKHPEPFTSEERCTKLLEEDKSTGLVGFEPLDTESFPEDSSVDTSDAHKGVLEFIHKELSLGPIREEVLKEDYSKQIADIQFNRLEESKESLRKLQERLSKEKEEKQVSQS